MMYLEAAAAAEQLKPQFAVLANRMTERFESRLNGRKVIGHADVYAPAEGSIHDYEAVGLLGFEGGMVLMDPSVLSAPDEALSAILDLIDRGLQ